jgi:D-alanyl-D-alanine carboxypeptidase/D-alanyl-D-alanine-endopeptidase (penicillin-binding protein 4)
LILLFAQQAFAGVIDKTISNSGINNGGISISVKDINSGKTVYGLNENKPTTPASTLKLITFNASRDTLGEDYQFSTKLYKSTNNDLYLKLGADPFLTSADLKKLFETAVSKNIVEPKNLYLDDYIFDSNEWGEGWQWDDDLSPLMPKFSSYNIDKNLLNIVIASTTNGAPANIYTTKFYPTTFLNLVTTGTSNDVTISRNNNISPDIITIEGTVKNQITKQIPINNMKRYFVFRCEDALRSAKINYYANITQKKTPAANVYLVDEINHSFTDTTNEILKNSNNLMAETVFKLAGAKYANNTGSSLNSQHMLNSYFDKINIDYSNIKVVDGSGVSKNNLVTADFMTEFLIKTIDNKELLATAGEGTLKNRMLYFKDNIRAKTGTLSDVSAIAGYITSMSGKTYAFDIMINDPKSKTAEKKSLEEYILRDIYTKF